MLRVWTEQAWQDYLSWQTDKAAFKRLNRLIEECCRTPFEGIGKPEPLRGDMAGLWSRRIDHEHRLVYRPEEERVVFFSARDHYHKR